MAIRPPPFRFLLAKFPYSRAGCFSSFESPRGVDDFLLRGDFSHEIKRVERGVFGAQLGLGFSVHFGGFEHPGVGRLGGAVDAGDFLFDAPFFFEFLGAQKVVVELPQFAFAEGVDERDDGGVIVVDVPKLRADVRGVALFDVGVVVLVVGS